MTSSNEWLKKFYQFVFIFTVSFCFFIYSLNETSHNRFKKSETENTKAKIFCMILTQPKTILTKVIKIIMQIILNTKYKFI